MQIKKKTYLENKLFPNILIRNKIEFKKYILATIIAAQNNNIALKLCSKTIYRKKWQIDEDGIRTHACTAQWISSPSP